MARPWRGCLLAVLLLWGTALPARGQEVGQDFDLKAGLWSYQVVVGRPQDRPAPYPLVIYHHGWGRDGLAMYELPKLAQRFAQAGFLFWAPQRYPGGDLGTAQEIGRRALAVALESDLVDPERIAVVGFSQGAVMSALTTLEHPRVKALALLGFGTLVDGRGTGSGGGALTRRLEGMDYARMACRVLIQVAGNDELVESQTQDLLCQRLRQAGLACRQVVYPGKRHQDLCGAGPYLDDLLDFLREGLR